MALQCFGHIEYLKTKITSGEYDIENLMSMIKTAEYYEKHNNNTPVYFDKYWQETNNLNNHEFKANITEVKDSIFTFQYFQKDKKLFEISYSSFYPNIKNGEFLSYSDIGKLQKKIIYTDNEPQDVKIYKKDLLHKHYKYVEQEKDSVPVNTHPRDRNKRRKKKYRYIDTPPKMKIIRLVDFQNENVVNDSGNFTYQVKDSVSGNLYTNTYKKGLLKKSYRLKDKDTIYQLSKEKSFDLFKLQTKLSDFKDSIDFSNSRLENAQGTVFISIIMNKKGQVESFKIFNKIHPEIDEYVSRFVKKNFDITSKFRYRFKRKQGIPKQYYETILPIHFSNNRFYRKPASYDYLNDFMWQNMMFEQQMMQQQMMNNAMRNF